MNKKKFSLACKTDKRPLIERLCKTNGQIHQVLFSPGELLALSPGIHFKQSQTICKSFLDRLP